MIVSVDVLLSDLRSVLHSNSPFVQPHKLSHKRFEVEDDFLSRTLSAGDFDYESDSDIHFPSVCDARRRQPT